MNAPLTMPNSTMTLKEITDLLEVRHNDAMKTVKTMMKKESFGDVTESSYRTTKGNSYKTYELNERQSIAVASRLNTDLLMRIIDRWKELENQQNQPAKLSRMEILQLALKAEEENQKLIEEIKVIEPKAKALDRIATADGSMTVTDSAKSLGMRQCDLRKWMNENKWVYKRIGSKDWIGYQDKIQQGLIEHKIVTIKIKCVNDFGENDFRDKVVPQVRILPKGLTKLSKLMNIEETVHSTA